MLDFPRELALNTVDMRVDFLRPARGKRIVAHGKVIRKGKRICVTVIEVTNDEGVLVAHGTASYSIMLADPGQAGEAPGPLAGLVDGNE